MICNLFSEPSWLIFSADLPPLLYYSHIPTALIALGIGFFVYLNGRQHLINRLLFAILLVFSLWTFSNLILWTNIHSDILLFVWSFLRVLSSLLSVLCVYFIYVFLNKQDVSLRLKGIFLVLLVPVIVLAPTSMNLAGFNINSCDAFAFESQLYTFYRIAFGLLAMTWISILLIRKYHVADSAFRKEIMLMGIGIEFFLFTFFTITYLAAYLTKIGLLPDSSLEFYGMFGMTVFMILISVMLVRFKTFNVGLIASQALVVAVLALVGSQYTYTNSLVANVLTTVTLVLTCLTGVTLIRSVRREIEQREVVEGLAKTLDETNGRQETLIHFIGHEVKGFLTKDSAAFASLLDGDFAPLPDAVRPFVTQALTESRNGADSVANILKASNLKKGTVTYDKKPFDMKELVAAAVEKARVMAGQKGLALNYAPAAGDYQLVGDGPQIADHVLRNLIENAINYTPSGSVTVALARAGEKIIFSVKDSGVGITAEDKARLFTEGGHGKDSQKVNAHSTGYGLYIAKQIVDAHKGTIRAESEGAGKGSTFIAEFPISA